MSRSSVRTLLVKKVQKFEASHLFEIQLRFVFPSEITYQGFPLRSVLTSLTMVYKVNLVLHSSTFVSSFGLAPFLLGHLPQPRSPPQLRLAPQLQRQPRSWRQPQTCFCSRPSFVFSLLKLLRTFSKLSRFLTSVSSDIQKHRL